MFHFDDEFSDEDEEKKADPPSQLLKGNKSLDNASGSEKSHWEGEKEGKDEALYLGHTIFIDEDEPRPKDRSSYNVKIEEGK